jgi:hypothetical protein
MQVLNGYLGKSVFVSRHAQERFAERASGDVASRLAAALPFGAQYGDGLLLRDEDIVFVSDWHPVHKRCVVTVLTIAQAVANMQYKGIRVPYVAILQLPPEHVAAVSPASESESARICRASASLTVLDDDEVAGLLEDSLCLDVSGLRGADKKAFAAARQALHLEHGRRNKIRKLQRHAQRMDDGREAIRLALREILLADLEMQVLARANELEAMGRENWPRYEKRTGICAQVQALTK